jgi:hypothetical protein
MKIEYWSENYKKKLKKLKRENDLKEGSSKEEGLDEIWRIQKNMKARNRKIEWVEGRKGKEEGFCIKTSLAGDSVSSTDQTARRRFRICVTYVFILS